MAGQLIKRGDRKYLIRIYLGRDASGKRRYFNKTVNGTKKEADKIKRQLLTRKDRGENLERPKGTVDEYLDAWLETTVEPSVRKRTLHDYTKTLERYVRPYIGEMPLAKVTPVEIRAMLVQLREKKKLSPRTVRKAHEVIRNALNQAEADGLIPSNPARGRLVSKALPQREKKKRQTIAPDQVPAFLKAAKGDRLEAFWTLMLFSGLRPSEALALTWEDVKGDAARVQRVLVDKTGVDLHFAPPKSNESRRAVVLNPTVVKELKAHRKRQAAEQLKAGEAWEDSGLVFTNEVGQPLRQDHIRDEFKKLLKRAKLPKMRVYDLRHSAATLLLEMGEDITMVKERLGHSTIALTADTYSHVSRGAQERAADKLEKLANGD